MRDWAIERRARTRQLIELGGLVMKAGLVEQTDDDRTLIYGALLAVAAKLRTPDGEQSATIWRRMAKRAFEADADIKLGGQNPR
jgi:Conjugal transfer protein TraD